MSEEERRGDGAAPGGPDHEALAEELRGLGHGIRIPDVDGGTMAERVLAQLLADRVPTPAVPAPGRARRAVRWLIRRWRVLSISLSGVLVVLVLTPPVRAAVADWFGFGGVEVRYDPSAPPRAGAAVPWCHAPVSLAEAERRVGFRPRVPGALRAPDAVSVTVGPEGRSVVSLCWSEGGRTVRLDEFAARLDPGFVKQARLMPRWVTLDSGSGTAAGGGAEVRTGLWFAEPHLLRFGMTDARGNDWVRDERTAGPTLLWTSEDARTTLRLEGVASLQRATDIAGSTH
ncbi:hypothetical protein [Streptomyces sp. NPDC002889]|uniref:hypothetical protein n=1 Tax=Streptomyces sp. NPDC002889 TaxID=3364669 RepID=UPI0036D0AFF4